MKNRSIRNGIILALALAAPVASASAKTVSVTNEGTDGPTCGLKPACRSITQAILVAAAGDTILVGPGIYGDIDGDGLFNTPGDERGQIEGCNCMLRVHKTVRIVSRDGATSTVLMPGPAGMGARVLITASNGTFGEVNKGFLITGDPSGQVPHPAHGIQTATSTTGVKIGGNTIVRASTGILVQGNGHVVRDNRVMASATGFDVRAGFVKFIRNTAIDNDQGVRLSRIATTVEENAIVGNPNGGLVVIGGVGHDVHLNLVAGNATRGVQVDEMCAGNLCCPGPACKNASASLWQNSIFGNGGLGNCGVMNAKSPTMGALQARQNYWGRAAGPGPDPGDAVCNFGYSTAVTLPVVTTEITPPIPAQK